MQGGCGSLLSPGKAGLAEATSQSGDYLRRADTKTSNADYAHHSFFGEVASGQLLPTAHK